MEAIVERDNLRKALAQVKRNKGAAGVDGMSLGALAPYLKEHWPTIRAQLLDGTYKPQPVRRVEAIFLLPFAYPDSAFTRNWSFNYQEAVWMCGRGDHQACDAMYRYEMARSAASHGSPADQNPAVSESLLVGGASAPLQPVQITHERRSHRTPSRAGLLWHRR
jgi:hypothetical protein